MKLFSHYLHSELRFPNNLWTNIIQNSIGRSWRLHLSLYEHFVPLTSALSPSPSHSSLISILMNSIPPLITLQMTAMRQGNDDGQLPMLEQQTKVEQWWWPLHALSSAIFHLSSALSSELCSHMRLEAQNKMMWNFLTCTCESKLTK